MSSTPATPLLSQLIQALRGLPGVGPRSAERLAYHLLQSKERGLRLAHVLEQTLSAIQHCERCHTFTEDICCVRCLDTTRDQKTLCVTENPYDLAAIEQSGSYQGGYYVLMGNISPLDGVGPEELGLARLIQRVKTESITEVIFALSPTVEGQTTLHCLQAMLKPFPIKLSQLAHGIPLGGELSMLDGFTISSALQHRLPLS